jgi:hypothetical protein
MLKKNLDDLDANGKKGDWCFLDNDRQIGIRYGDNAFAGTVVIPIAGNNRWLWNGDKDLPTISPSILVHDVPGFTQGWHGFLTDGIVVDV